MLSSHRPVKRTRIKLNKQLRKHVKSKHFALTLCKTLSNLTISAHGKDTRPRCSKQDEDSLYLIIAYRREDGCETH
jgi:hypothetical protein